jgi:hypothetical protein
VGCIDDGSADRAEGVSKLILKQGPREAAQDSGSPCVSSRDTPYVSEIVIPEPENPRRPKGLRQRWSPMFDDPTFAGSVPPLEREVVKDLLRLIRFAQEGVKNTTSFIEIRNQSKLDDDEGRRLELPPGMGQLALNVPSDVRPLSAESNASSGSGFSDVTSSRHASKPCSPRESKIESERSRGSDRISRPSNCSHRHDEEWSRHTSKEVPQATHGSSEAPP